MKWLGALLIVLGCSGCGFLMGEAYRREERLLRQLQESITWLQWELRCHGSDLPGMFYRAAERTDGPLKVLFQSVSRCLSDRVAPNARVCMETALQEENLPEKTKQIAMLLGGSLGEFDLEGQLGQLETVRMECSRLLEEHTRSRDSRIRSYQTLGICGGLALAILLL